MTTIDNTATTVATTSTTAPAVPAAVEPADPDATVERLLQVLDDGAACVLASIGHEVGLFDTLAALPPATSAQVADAAGLDERYVREWLGGMTTARFVRYAPEDRTYELSPDHAPFLTGDSPDNLARMTRYITMMGQVSSLVAEKFRTGGGLSYDDYPGFHDLQAAESAAVNDASLLDTIIPVAGETERLQQGIDVADVGCGEGHAVNLLARAYPRSTFVGYDFSDEALRAARAEAAAWGLGNARFETLDVADLDAQSAYDLVLTFDAVHDQAQPGRVLANLRRALRPGGTYLMVDIKASSNLEENLELPWATFLHAISTTHCMSVSLGQGGVGLGTVWGVQTMERMLHEAGFSDVVVHDLEEDPFNAYVVARP
jgi:SAM-dependent methyltransferase